MIVETALALAGPSARLVARPTGVAHVYTGPLTPSGRFVPRRSRTVCRTRTAQLHTLPQPERWSSLTCEAAAFPRLCARCTACLDRVRARSRQATTTPCTRHAALAAWAGTTKADIAFALDLATSPSEVDAAAWLSLLLFDVAGCAKPFTEHGRQWPPLSKLVYLARGRVDGFPDSLREASERANAMSTAAREQRKAENKAARAEREAQIERLGFNNANPVPRRPRRI